MSWKKYINYDLKDAIQILEAEEFSKIKQQWYDNTSNLPNPVNEPNFERAWRINRIFSHIITNKFELHILFYSFFISWLIILI